MTMIPHNDAINSLMTLAPFIGSAATWSLAEPCARADGVARQFVANASTVRVPYQVSFVVDAKRIMNLRPGWDGPGSVAIDTKILQLARSLTVTALENVVDAVAPQLMPGGDGSVQLEWHERHGEIEFLIEPDGTFSIWGRDHRNGLEFEGCGAAAADLFYRWAPWISSPQSHALDVPPSPKPALFEIAA